MGILTFSPLKRRCRSFFSRFLTATALLFCCQLAISQTSITSDITSNFTWDLANSPYSIDADVSVAVGVTLTIDPGVTVNFTNNNFDLTIHGTLLADGGPGADTIRFQNSLASILLSSSSTGSIIDHTRFEGMGAFNIAALHVSSDATITNSKFVDCEVGVTVAAGASPSIQDCEMFSSNDYGIRVDDGSPTITGVTIDGDNQVTSAGIWIQMGTPTITNSTFQNTRAVGAIWIDQAIAPTLDNNTFTNNTVDVRTHPMLLDDAHYDNNGLSVIHVSPVNITGNTTWQAPLAPESWVYEMVFGDITVEAGNTLTIEPGTEIVYTSNGQDLFVDGTLVAVGTASDSIRIRDGNATIELRAGSSSSMVDFVRMDGMGAFNIAGLVISSDATVSNSKFVNNEVGITVLSGAAPVIQDCEFFSSSDYGIRVDNGSPTINNVIIDGDNVVPAGGIWIQAGTPAITNSTLRNTGNVGGIWLNTTDVPTIDNNTFTNNTRDILAHPMALDDVNFDNNGISTIYIDNDNVTSSTIWHQPVLPESWNYILTGALTVSSGTTLTLEPGVDVTFTNSSHDMTINGTLDATGTAADSIRFTGGFASIFLTATSTGSTIDYVKMQQMGAFNIAGLQISSDATINHSKFSLSEVGITVNNNASPIIQNSEFFDFSDYGIQIDSGDPTITNVLADGNSGGSGGAWIKGGTPTITGSVFQNIIGNGIHIDAAVVPIIDGNSFSGNGRDLVAHPEILDDENFDNNGLSLVHIDNEPVTANTTWQKAQAPEGWVYSTVNSFSVDAGITLTIEPGVEIQFDGSSHDFTVNGTLLAQGTATDPISLNSGGASMFLSTSSTGSIFDYVRMEGLGAFNVAALAISSDATIANSLFDGCEVGISVDNSASPSIQSTLIRNSADQGMLVSSGSPSINNSAIYDNPTGINNTGAGTVDATSNWWGDVSGPTHTSNPTGTGDIVSDNVTFTPFLLENPLEPDGPDNLTTTEISDTQIDLNWSDNSTIESGYSIERSDGNNTNFLEIGTVATDIVTYSDNTVVAGNGYFYRVQAIRGIAASDYSNEKFAGTIAPPGNALLFDGVDDDVTFSEPIQTTYSDFTIEFWTKVPATNSGQVNYFIQEDPAGGGTPQIVIAATFSNTLYFFLRETNGGTNSSVQGATLINDDNWHHVAYVKEGAALRVYLDGELDGSAASFAGDIVFPNSAVGNMEGDATLDEFRFWDSALDIDQIRSFGSSTLDGTEANLSSYYRFDQDENTDLNLMDRTSNTVNGIWSDGGGGTTTPQWVASGAFSVDLVPPTAVSQDISVSLDATGNVTITPDQIDNGSTDNQTAVGDLVLTLDVSTFDCTDIGGNTVTLTVTDEEGKSSTTTATVTISDNVTPTVVTQDINVSLDGTGNATIVTGDIDNGSSDNCSVSLSLDITTFDCTDLGGNTVTLTGTDGSGNNANATATVTITDATAPIMSAMDIFVNLNVSGVATIVPTDVNNGSSDNCSFALGLDLSIFDCTNIGTNTVTLTGTDGSGNSANTTAIVTVSDNTAPVVSAMDISLSLDAAGNATITTGDVDSGSTDNCSTNLSLDITTFDCADIGANTVTLTGTDDEGNSANVTAIVTVVDTVDPIVLTQDVTVVLGSGGLGSITTGDIDNGTTDNCTFTLSLDVTDFTSADIGANTVTLTATDESGNTATATAIVTVESGNLPPDFFFTYFLEENSPVGKLIGTIVATDPEGDPLTYTILSGNTNAAFALGSSSGDLTVNSQEALDFETTPVFDLVVQTDDGNGGTSMVSITINLLDVNEEMVTAIDEISVDVSVYPNPAQEALFVELNGLNAEEVRIEMFTVSGSQVLKAGMVNARDELLEIDLQGLSSGIYVLKIQNSETMITKNVFVK